jgi:RHS repeat-associated protein
MDRVATRKDQLNRQASYAYDLTGNLASRTDRKGLVTSFTYDALNRAKLVGYNTLVNGSTTTYESTTAFTYDSGNRLTQAVDSAGGTITEAYDNLDRLTTETTAQGSISYGYDNASRRTSMTVAGQPQVSYSYDNANRLTQIAQGSSSVGFSYDNANRRSSLALPNGVSVSYAFDNDSRITGITYNFNATTLGTLSYSYDQLGRRTQVGGSFARTNLPGAVLSATYDAANQLTNWNGTAISYDSNGNMLSDGTNAFTWNARNQVARLNSANLQYDAVGRRIKNAAGTSFVFDGPNASQELSGSTVAANIWTGGLDEIFQRTDANGTVVPLTDALGSTIALVNSSGNVQTTYSYDPFGDTTATGAASANPSQYTGRENEGNGLYYLRARYYSPLLGRFISEDPLGFGGSGPNSYAYVFNSPTNLVDPSGLESGNLNKLVPGPNGEIATGAPLTPEQQARENAYLSFPFDIRNYVPTHGNWCGPNWSGGINPTINDGSDGIYGPVDALDALCMRHDHMYDEVAKCRAAMDKKHQKVCDR